MNVVSSLLKLFVRKLPESIICPGNGSLVVISSLLVLTLHRPECDNNVDCFTEFYDRLIAANRLKDYRERMLRIKEILDELPDINFLTLRFLMEHLNEVASRHSDNKVWLILSCLSTLGTVYYISCFNNI